MTNPSPVTVAPSGSVTMPSTSQLVRIVYAGFARDSLELGGHGARASDGHAPLAGAVADQVIEEAAVLDQCAVVQRSERTDQRVSGDDPANDIVGESALDGCAEWFLDQIGPDRHLDLVAEISDIGGVVTAAWATLQQPPSATSVS